MQPAEQKAVTLAYIDQQVGAIDDALEAAEFDYRGRRNVLRDDLREQTKVLRARKRRLLKARAELAERN